MRDEPVVQRRWIGRLRARSSLTRHSVVRGCANRANRPERAVRATVRLAATAIMLVALAVPAAAQELSEETYKFFELNCQSCHTIGGGRLAGPDLKGLLERRDRPWLQKYLLNPKAVIDSGDAYAQTLLREARGVYMPTPPGITPALADKLLDLMQAESALEKSRFAGLQISDRPLTEADVALGGQLFRGEVAIASGAPACFSCHTLQGAEGFGGGRLGPDLTAVYARMEGRKPLAAWLSAPPSPMMTPIFRKAPLSPDEVLALTAFFKETSAGGAESAETDMPAFLLSGFGLAALLLVLFDVIWSKRYRATRRPLIEKRLLRRRVMEEQTP